MKGVRSMDELLEILNDINPDADYETNEHLVDDEILTSFELVMLVTQIRDVLDVSIPSEAIIPENFNSVKAMMRLIGRLKEDE